jgi:hypothetical protein
VPKLTYEQMDYEPMEIGSYEAVFTRYEEEEMEHGPVYKLPFEITTDEKYEGKELSRFVSQKFKPKSNLLQTVHGVRGRPIRGCATAETR